MIMLCWILCLLKYCTSLINKVYGETSFDMVAQILEECHKQAEEIFVDLGSGMIWVFISEFIILGVCKNNVANFIKSKSHQIEIVL